MEDVGADAQEQNPYGVARVHQALLVVATKELGLELRGGHLVLQEAQSDVDVAEEGVSAHVVAVAAADGRAIGELLRVATLTVHVSDDCPEVVLAVVRVGGQVVVDEMEFGQTVAVVVTLGLGLGTSFALVLDEVRIVHHAVLEDLPVLPVESGVTPRTPHLVAPVDPVDSCGALGARTRVPQDLGDGLYVLGVADVDSFRRRRESRRSRRSRSTSWCTGRTRARGASRFRGTRRRDTAIGRCFWSSTKSGSESWERVGRGSPRAPGRCTGATRRTRSATSGVWKNEVQEVKFGQVKSESERRVDLLLEIDQDAPITFRGHVGQNLGDLSTQTVRLGAILLGAGLLDCDRGQRRGCSAPFAAQLDVRGLTLGLDSLVQRHEVLGLGHVGRLVVA
eukprot:355651-Prorocentrum_minimum.AAC.13